MTKILKEGENLYKFTDEEIRTICNSLMMSKNRIIQMTRELQFSAPQKAINELKQGAEEIQQLQFSIEQQDHNL